jgi:hypothetical protein
LISKPSGSQSEAQANIMERGGEAEEIGDGQKTRAAARHA